MIMYAYNGEDLSRRKFVKDSNLSITNFENKEKMCGKAE